MKKDKDYTDKEIDNFLDETDFEIIEFLHESNMLDEQIEFRQFLEKYQVLHLKKYGSYLSIKN